MNSYALLNLFHGLSNSMGLPEIKFHYPPQAGREKELSAKAIDTLKTYNFQTNFHWALVDENNFPRFKEFLQTVIPDSEVVTIPKDIMHGVIGFAVCLRLNGFQQSDKEQLLDTIMQTGIPPHKSAEDFMFRRKKEAPEFFGGALTTEEIQAETRATFSRNLHFYAETNS
jgi:hypothetical protein